MASQSEQFKSRAHDALTDAQLQKALAVIPEGFVGKRSKAKASLKEFDQLSDRAVAIKNHTLANLDKYLEQFEEMVIKSGGMVHFAPEGEDARQIITELCKAKNARLIAKGKTMVGEEIELTQHLEEQGFETVETDLGEYLIQLRHEIPSHIIAPAVHLTREKIRGDFLKTHTNLPKDRPLDTPEDFVKEARAILREKFVNADIGITGANFIIAETGSTIIVTNEGNGDLCSSLPKTHIVITSIEKLVPTYNDAAVMLRLLARSATGQSISTYTTLTTGPNHSPVANNSAKQTEGNDEPPAEFHVIILDNGRTEMLGSKFHEMLRCIRCGACINHCPVYQNLGGHAYGSVYPGPMGAVLSPQYFGDQANELPFASSFCGRCNEVCPMQIPLTKMMRHWREDATEGSREDASEGGREDATEGGREDAAEGTSAANKAATLKRPRRHISSATTITAKLTMKLWANLAKRPKLYNHLLKLALPFIAWFSKRQSLTKLTPGLSAWLKHRELPQIASKSFQTQWQQRKRGM